MFKSESSALPPGRCLSRRSKTCQNEFWNEGQRQWDKAKTQTRPTLLLHVRNVFGILDFGGVHREQILSSRFLPFIKGAALKGGDTHFAKVLALLGTSFLLLHFLPLCFGHATGCIDRRRAFCVGFVTAARECRRRVRNVLKDHTVQPHPKDGMLLFGTTSNLRMYSIVMPAELLDCTPTDDPAKEDDTENPLTADKERRAIAVKDFIVFCRIALVVILLCSPTKKRVVFHLLWLMLTHLILRFSEFDCDCVERPKHHVAAPTSVPI